MTTSTQVELPRLALLDIRTMQMSPPNGVRAAELARNRALVSPPADRVPGTGHRNSPPVDRVTSHVRLVSYKYKARSTANKVKDVAGPNVPLSVSDTHTSYLYEVFHKEELCQDTCILCYHGNLEHVDSLALKEPAADAALPAEAASGSSVTAVAQPAAETASTKQAALKLPAAPGATTAAEPPAKKASTEQTLPAAVSATAAAEPPAEQASTKRKLPAAASATAAAEPPAEEGSTELKQLAAASATTTAEPPPEEASKERKLPAAASITTAAEPPAEAASTEQKLPAATSATAAAERPAEEGRTAQKLPAAASTTAAAEPPAEAASKKQKLPAAPSATAATEPPAEEARTKRKLPAAPSAVAPAGPLAEPAAENASTPLASTDPGSGPAAGSAAWDSPTRLGVAETVKLFQFLSEEVNSLFEAYGLHTTLLEQELQKKYDALERESQQQFDALDQEWQKKYDALVADMTLVARAGIGLAGVWCANEVLDLHNDPETRTASQPLLKSVQREGSGVRASAHPADFIHVVAHMEGDECKNSAAVALWQGWKAQGLDAGLLRAAYAALSRELHEMCKGRKVLYLQKSKPAAASAVPEAVCDDL